MLFAAPDAVIRKASVPRRRIRRWLGANKLWKGGASIALAMFAQSGIGAETEADSNTAPAVAHEQLLGQYCSKCHNDERLAGDLSFATFQAADFTSGTNLAEWEKILRMTRRGEMPPRNRPQPPPETMQSFVH